MIQNEGAKDCKGNKAKKDVRLFLKIVIDQIVAK